MTRAEFAAKVIERADYHDAIGDPRVAGVLRLVLADLDNVDALADAAPDKMLSLEAAADRLDVTVRWLRENRPPYVVELSPKILKVSEKRLAQWLRRS